MISYYDTTLPKVKLPNSNVVFLRFFLIELHSSLDWPDMRTAKRYCTFDLSSAVFLFTILLFCFLYFFSVYCAFSVFTVLFRSTIFFTNFRLRHSRVNLDLFKLKEINFLFSFPIFLFFFSIIQNSKFPIENRFRFLSSFSFRRLSWGFSCSLSHRFGYCVTFFFP